MNDYFAFQRLPEEIKIKHEKLKEEMIGKIAVSRS